MDYVQFSDGVVGRTLQEAELPHHRERGSELSQVLQQHTLILSDGEQKSLNYLAKKWQNQEDQSIPTCQLMVKQEIDSDQQMIKTSTFPCAKSIVHWSHDRGGSTMSAPAPNLSFLQHLLRNGIYLILSSSSLIRCHKRF